jgi:hypothetical protein
VGKQERFSKRYGTSQSPGRSDRFRKVSEAVGLVARITPSYGRTGAELRQAKATFGPFVLAGDESVIEVHVLGDETAIVRETVGDFRKKGARRTMSLLMPVRCAIFSGIDRCGIPLRLVKRGSGALIDLR